MKLQNQKPREFINPLLSKKNISSTKFNEFKANFAQYRIAIDQQHAAKQSEPNIVTNALKPFVDSLGYVSHSYTQKGQSGIDLAILNNGNPAVLFEVKKHKSVDMVSCDKPNTKAFQEAVLYFMRERDKGNQSIFHIVITDFYDWFVIDAKDFDRLFWRNKKVRELFDAHKNPAHLGDTTKEFYTELHKAIAKLKLDPLDEEFIECAYFETSSVKTEKDLIGIYKLLSPDCLVKAFNPNDANRLNREFYSEFLYLLGLEEVAEGTKKTISQAAMKQAGSLFENITNKLSQHNKKNDFDTVISLIIIWVNRILFLKLLESQIVNWTNDASNNFLSIDKVDQYSRLEELFFEILAKPIDKRNTSTFNYIPYLNSSLFEINPEETAGITIGALSANAQLKYHAKTVLKDEHSKRKTGSVNALRYLFDFLDAYDFGNNSNVEVTDDSKALINASVLGLIFEKINGYKDGSFYTPSFITMYMAREIIQKTVLEKFRAAFAEELKDATWPELKRYCHARSHKDLFNKSASALIDTITVCDPAVGSGHYLVSVLNELVSLKFELGLLQQKGVRVALLNDELHVMLDDEWFEYKLPKSFESPSHLLQKALFMEKQRIIENQLFGVDINRNSTQITKLRLWIELLKHSYYDPKYQLVTLPNIDINIKTGNSVVHRFALSDDIKDRNIKAEIAKYKLKVQEYKGNIGSKHAVMAAIGGIKETFNKTLKSRHKSTKALDQKLVEYVNLFGFTGLRKELRAMAVEATQGQEDFFGVDPQIAKKHKAKNTDLANVVSRLYERVKDMENGVIYHDAFEWRFEFPEVLDETGEFIGFDAVIANPPYIDSEKMINDGHEDIREHLADHYSCARGNWDLYIVFMELGLKIMKKTGTMSYITPDKWISKPFGNEFRTQHIGGIESIVELGRDVFESALVDSIITQVSNTPVPKICTSVFENGKLTPQNTVLKSEMDVPYFLDPLLSEHYRFISKLGKKHGRLDDIIQCESACATADAYKIKPFVKDNATKFKPKSQYMMVNTGTLGKYVSRWGVKPMTYLGDKYLRPVVSRDEFDANFVNTYKTKSDSKKIIVKGLTLLDATVDLSGEMIAGKTTLVLPDPDVNKLKYVAAILNSPIAIFYIKAKYGSASYNGGVTFTKDMVNSIPLPKSQKKVRSVTAAVDAILAAKAVDHFADIGKWEKVINDHLYTLYDLSPDEIVLVNGSLKSSEPIEEEADAS